MLVVDELKKNDPQLRFLALMLAAGLFILLASLWWLQIVSAREYRSSLETQQFRTVRVPAVRGKILDRQGQVLAENRASYNLCLYLNELRKPFAEAGANLVKQARAEKKAALVAEEKRLGRSLTKTERKKFALTTDQLFTLRQQGRTQVAAEVIARISAKLGEPIPFNPKKFNRHYQQNLVMPFTLIEDMDEAQMAKFHENFPGGLGADLELQSVRYYPYETTAAHLVGELRQDDSSAAGEESFFNYRLPDYRGVTGVEAKFNSELRGRAGVVSVLVNNMGYKQSEDVETQPLAGANVTLTLDLELQHACEKALSDRRREKDNCAIVVMDVNSGDVLAMVSTPTFDPNRFAQGISHAEYQQLQELEAEKNRATFENYAPGSIFKPFVALAALEKGLNPKEIYRVQADPSRPGRGCIFIGKRKIEDTAAPGNYDFKRALIHSSNAYFIWHGLEAGVENIVQLGKEFHLGERTGIFTNQETRGSFPTIAQVSDKSSWRDGHTANLCIGQGPVDVTPIQMAVAYSAIANGGAVLQPRIVAKIEPQDSASGVAATNFPSGVVRNRISVQPRNLKILHDAMFADVQSSEGTGRKAAVPGFNICAKTGTAQVQDSANRLKGHNYWFASFGPYERPRYAVVVLVQSATEGGSGGDNCAPIARDIYEAIVKREAAPKLVARN